MSTILITGASRGLGLELCRQYLAEGHRLHACARGPEASGPLAALAEAHPQSLRLHRLEVTDAGQVAGLAAALGQEGIDLLIHNAGIYPDKDMGYGTMDVERWLEAFHVNTIAPLKVSEALTEHVARSQRKVIAIVTSLMGSIGETTTGGSYAYRSSKAAVNMVARCMAIDLKPRGITCVLLHPGWVKTDMGGPSAPLEKEESCRGMRAVLDGVTPADSGRFLRWDGREVVW